LTTVIDPFINIATVTAGFKNAPLVSPTKNIASASAAPITSGFPPLAKRVKMKKRVPKYSEKYDT
jgi:hypothetical protein